MIKYSVIITIHKQCKSFIFEQFLGLLTISIFDQKNTHNLFPVELFEGLPVHLEIGFVFSVVDLLEVVGAKFAVDGLAYFAFGVPALGFVATLLVLAHDVEVDA